MSETLCYWCNEPTPIGAACYCCEECGEQHIIDSLRMDAGLPMLSEVELTTEHAA